MELGIDEFDEDLSEGGLELKQDDEEPDFDDEYEDNDDQLGLEDEYVRSDIEGENKSKRGHYDDVDKLGRAEDNGGALSQLDTSLPPDSPRSAHYTTGYSFQTSFSHHRVLQVEMAAIHARFSAQRDAASARRDHDQRRTSNSLLAGVGPSMRHTENILMAQDGEETLERAVEDYTQHRFGHTTFANSSSGLHWSQKRSCSRAVSQRGFSVEVKAVPPVNLQFSPLLRLCARKASHHLSPKRSPR